MSKCFNLLPGSYFESQQVKPDRLCYGFIAIVKGTANCNVNGIILNGSLGPGLSGESFTYVDPQERIYVGNLQVEFTSAGTQILQIVQVLKIGE